MERARFVRRREDFECEQCGAYIEGTGYTNHCSYCLYSKHVDWYPGDRAVECSGLMKPYAVSVKSGWWSQLYHRCEKCGATDVNRVSEGDSQKHLRELL